MTELKFSELSLTPEVQRGVADAGFTYCTPIQSKTLPLALGGRDVAGQAQTGTGKTAAYLIALYQYLLTHEPLDAREPGPRALIVAPTRELAVQIHNDATLLGAHLPFRLGLAFGGTDYEKQKRHLAEGVDLLIGTPGRLIDFFKQGVFGLRRVQVAVLDEADRMFDLGFLRDIRYILRRLPPFEQRLNMLFSATLSYRVLELAYEHMNDPELVRIEPDKLTVDRIRQAIYFPSNEEKLPLLITLLREMDATRTMVFVNTRRAAERLQDALEHNGIQAAALSGDVPQPKRLRMLRDFQAGELPVLIATDVASRGLHVPDVSHVFNYDLPQDPEDYVHRIGRTARAGAFGDAVSFGCEDYVVSLPEIEAYIGRKIDVGTFDHEKLTEVSVPKLRPRRSAERRDGGGPRRAGSGNGSGPRRPGGGSGGSSRRPGGGTRRDGGGGRESRSDDGRRPRPETERERTGTREGGPKPDLETRSESGAEPVVTDERRGSRRRPRRSEPREPRGPRTATATRESGGAASNQERAAAEPGAPHAFGDATEPGAPHSTSDATETGAPRRKRRRKRGRRGSGGQTAGNVGDQVAESSRDEAPEGSRGQTPEPPRGQAVERLGGREPERSRLGDRAPERSRGQAEGADVRTAEGASDRVRGGTDAASGDGQTLPRSIGQRLRGLYTRHVARRLKGSSTDTAPDD